MSFERQTNNSFERQTNTCTQIGIVLCEFSIVISCFFFCTKLATPILDVRGGNVARNSSDKKRKQSRIERITRSETALHSDSLCSNFWLWEPQFLPIFQRSLFSDGIVAFIVQFFPIFVIATIKRSTKALSFM